MSEAASVALSPETVLAQIKQNGVTDIVWLPDSETNWLYLLMKAETSLRLVGVNREGMPARSRRALRPAGASR
jgi:sulfopyruvate decarboxylase subunit alpha